VLVHASELGGLELGGKRNSSDVEIIQLLRLVPLGRTPVGCQPTRLRTNAGKEPSNLTVRAHVALLFHSARHHPQEPVELRVPLGGTGSRSDSVYSAG